MKTYLVAVEGQYVDFIAVDGYGTNADDSKAVILDYAEAVELCHRINRNAGKIDKAVMVEAIEQDEYEAEDNRDEHQKRADAQAEYADDSRDDR
jgi:hypothetical protein